MTKAIDDFIDYMCADETVKVTDMLIMVSPKDESKHIGIDAAETAKLLQQLYTEPASRFAIWSAFADTYTEMLVERIMEKGLDYLLRR
jgi:hypothetical protein